MAQAEQEGSRNPEYSPPMRVLVEGGMEDDWFTHHTMILEREIPQDCEVIRILRYNLSLVAVWEKGEIRQTETRPGQEIKFPNDGEVWGDPDEGKMHRPTTIITQDGRIYHDRDLLVTGRLDHFLSTMSKELEDHLFEGKKPRVSTGRGGLN